MTGQDSIDEIIDFAIEGEIEANQFYLDLAGRVKNAAMRKVFEDFAQEELGHKAKLEAMKSGEVTLSMGKVPDLKIADYAVEAEVRPNMDYQDALLLAMKNEKASFNLYTDLAEAAEDNTVRETFLSLAQEEAKHKLRFELEYDDVILKQG